jgi:hypothetical protein
MKKSIIAGLLVLMNFLTFAQTREGVWLNVGINKKITKKLAIDLSIENRWTGLADFHQTYFGEIGTSYKIHKNISLSGYYRLINRRKDETSAYKQRHRFYGNLQLNKKLGIIEAKYRLRYQNQFRDTDNELAFDKSYLRHKFEIALNTKTFLTPYASGDWFYQLGRGIDEVRYKAGVDIKLSKFHRLDVGAFLSQPLGTSTDERRIIYDVSYTYKF